MFCTTDQPDLPQFKTAVRNAPIKKACRVDHCLKIERLTVGPTANEKYGLEDGSRNSEFSPSFETGG